MIKNEQKHYSEIINYTESSFQFKYSTAMRELRAYQRNEPGSEQTWGWQVRSDGVATRTSYHEIHSTLTAPWELPVHMPPPELSVQLTPRRHCIYPPAAYRRSPHWQGHLKANSEVNPWKLMRSSSQGLLRVGGMNTQVCTSNWVTLDYSAAGTGP